MAGHGLPSLSLSRCSLACWIHRCSTRTHHSPWSARIFARSPASSCLRSPKPTVCTQCSFADELVETMPHFKGNKFKQEPLALVAAPESAVAPSVAPPDARNSVEVELAPQPKRCNRPRLQLNTSTAVLTPPTGQPADSAAVSSNWAVLKAHLSTKKSSYETGRKRKADALKSDNDAAAERSTRASRHPNLGPAPGAQPTRIVALDCEMVGAGEGGELSLLARVCVVNAAGSVLYDSFVQPTARVTDYRTRWSGVRAADLRDAPSFEAVQAAVSALLRGRVLVGHAVENDLQVLLLTHPANDIRDTSRYPPFMKALANGKTKPRALRHLAQEELGLLIQGREHCPVEDARAALSLYQKRKAEWEEWLGQRRSGNKAHVRAMEGTKSAAHGKPFAAPTLAELAMSDYMADL